jgi:Ca-activated chloride channel family protein
VLLEQRLPGQRRIGILARALALVCLTVGAAGPEWGFELVRRSALGSEVVLLVDVSASMDVRDVPPSRIEEARREAIAVLDRLQGSKVGVVAFAGDAVRLCPLTLDRSAARLVLESLSSATVGEPGSDLGRGLRAAARLLPPKRRGEQLVVVWTDGEDLEAGARGTIDELVRAGLRVFAVGVGTAAGDVVPVLDERGRVVDVKRDDAGGPVRSRLDEGLLQRLARRTRGAYFSASRPGGELPRLLGALGSVGRGERGERLVERPVERFAWFTIAAALLLGFDRIRRRRRTPAADPGADMARTLTAAALLVACVAWAVPAGAQSAWARGDGAFRKRRWAAAESLYALRLKGGAPAEVRVNLATTRARAGKGNEAREALSGELAAPGRAGQTAAYNLGTLQSENRDWDGALRHLRRALERDPGDEDARFNYEWTLRRREEERRRQNSQSQQPPPQPQPSQPQPQSPSTGTPPPQPPPPSAQPPPPPEMGHGLDRRQAEQLLGSLQELERLEQQRMRRVRVLRDRRGKDW